MFYAYAILSHKRSLLFMKKILILSFLAVFSIKAPVDSAYLDELGTKIASALKEKNIEVVNDIGALKEALNEIPAGTSTNESVEQRFQELVKREEATIIDIADTYFQKLERDYKNVFDMTNAMAIKLQSDGHVDDAAIESWMHVFHPNRDELLKGVDILKALIYTYPLAIQKKAINEFSRFDKNIETFKQNKELNTKFQEKFNNHENFTRLKSSIQQIIPQMNSVIEALEKLKPFMHIEAETRDQLLPHMKDFGAIIEPIKVFFLLKREGDTPNLFQQVSHTQQEISSDFSDKLKDPLISEFMSKAPIFNDDTRDKLVQLYLSFQRVEEEQAQAQQSLQLLAESLNALQIMHKKG